MYNPLLPSTAEEVVLGSGETVLRTKKTYNFWLVDHYKEGSACTINSRQTFIEEVIALNRLSLVSKSTLCSAIVVPLNIK
jgi:hypothetical protein